VSGKRKCRASLNLHMQRNDQFFPSNDAAPGGCPTEFFNRIGRDLSFGGGNNKSRAECPRD
jgi:hypothetical protein